MRIGLYLQGDTFKRKPSFDKAMAEARDAKLDLLVFPEMCYVPWAEELAEKVDVLEDKNYKSYLKEANSLSKYCKCALLLNHKDTTGKIVSIYVNAMAKNDDDKDAYFIKNTCTPFSALDYEYYDDIAYDNYIPIKLKGKRIGVTICNDITNPLFSGIFGSYGVDILINQTGGNVREWKWKPFARVRAIENNCISMCTMGDSPKESGKSFVMGFNKNGKELKPVSSLVHSNDSLDVSGTIYIYDTDTDTDAKEILFDSEKQYVTEESDFELPVGKIMDYLEKAEKLDENVYCIKHKDVNVIFCVLQDDFILTPYNVPYCYYWDKVDSLQNKRYIIVAKMSHLSKEDFETLYSEVLGVRCIENKAAVILESDNYNMCITTDNHKHVRYIAEENGVYRIKLDFIKGPEAIWDNPDRRAAYEWLLDNWETMYETE